MALPRTKKEKGAKKTKNMKLQLEDGEAKDACTTTKAKKHKSSKRENLGCGLTQPTDTDDGTHCITIGSDCAGLCSEGIALELLGVKHRHMFTSEMNKSVRHLLYNAYGKGSMTYYTDVTARRHDLVPKVDIYVFGPPCQPFSPAGQGKGVTDPRSHAFSSCIDYIAEQRPKCFICENSHRLLSKKFAEVWSAILTKLKRLRYSLSHRVINTKDHGIPQSRPRTYLVGVRRDIKVAKFRFPDAIPAEPVDLFLDDNDKLTKSCRRQVVLPKTSNTQAVLNRAYNILKEKGARPAQDPCFVETGASLAWSSVMIGTSPCLTATRCGNGGHFMTHRRRLMTVSEMCRLQGLPPNRINYRQAKVSSKVFARAVGNMMSVNVLQRILPALLKSAGLLEASGHLEAPTVFSHRLLSKTCDEVADEEVA